MRSFLVCGFFLFLTSCGYHTLDHPTSGRERVTLSVPSIPKDGRGLLNMALVRALSDSGYFICSPNDGKYRLDVELQEDVFDRVGFRYDRNPSGGLRDNLVGTENRRTVAVSIRVVDSLTDKIVLGPEKFSTDLVYDYVDPDNLYDQSFVDAAGIRLKTINVSLGQLDSIEGAQDSSASELYHKLAEKIADGLISHSW